MSRSEGIWVETSDREITLRGRRIQYVTPVVTRTSWRRARTVVEIPDNQANGEDLGSASGVVAQSPARSNEGRCIQYVTRVVTRTSQCRARTVVEILAIRPMGEGLGGATGVVAQSPGCSDDISEHHFQLGMLFCYRYKLRRHLHLDGSEKTIFENVYPVHRIAVFTLIRVVY